MFKNLLKAIFKTGKSATETVGKSMDFIDDVLEKEYIANAVDNVKESTGKVVEKAGEVYQRSKDAIDENVSLEKLKDKVDDVIEKGKDLTSELADEMLEKSSTLKNVMDEGKEMVKDFFEEE